MVFPTLFNKSTGDKAGPPRGWGSKTRSTNIEAKKEISPKSSVRVHSQNQSSFFTKLPAEIRNEIYMFTVTLGPRQRQHQQDRRRIFPRNDENIDPLHLAIEAARQGLDHTSGTPVADSYFLQAWRNTYSSLFSPSKQAPKLPAHPLSLLLTCRRLNTEATLLVFSTHFFRVPPTLPFYRLRRRSEQLSRAQFNSITRIELPACAINEDKIPVNSLYGAIGAGLGSVLCLFPRVTELRIAVGCLDHAHGWEEEDRSEYMEKHEDWVPWWFKHVLEHAVLGQRCGWQVGEKWNAVMPEPHCGARLAVEGDGACRVEYTALLLQETGRRVHLLVVCEWDAEAAEARKRKELADAKAREAAEARRRRGLGVVLVPGTESLPVKVVHPGTYGSEGLMWTPGGYNDRGLLGSGIDWAWDHVQKVVRYG